MPIDMMRQGISISGFQPQQQWLTISPSSVNARLDGQVSRMNCQTFSITLSSWLFAGSGSTVMLAGTSRSPDQRYPA